MLHWVKSQKQLQAFVHHCITEMQLTLTMAKWRYCPTLESPADLLTRGITTETLVSSSLWQNRPAWLTTPDRLPSFDSPPLPPLLVVAVATEFVSADPATPALGLHSVISLNQYSSLCKLLCVSASVFRFIGNVQTEPDHRHYGPVGAEKFTTMRFKWIKDTCVCKKITNLQLVSKPEHY